MLEHPIQGLMSTAMENIKEMVDVNTIVGDPVNCQDGSVIIPISKVSFGFAAGGGEYGKTEEVGAQKPFAGGSGAGISISPVAFMVVGQNQIKLLPVNAPGDRAIEMVATLAEKLVQWAQNSTNQNNAGQAVGQAAQAAAQAAANAANQAAQATKSFFTSGFSNPGAQQPPATPQPPAQNQGTQQPEHHNDNPQAQMAPNEELD